MTETRRPEEHPELHEQTDVSFRPLATFAAVFLLLMAAFLLLLYWMFGRFESAVRATEKPDSALTAERRVLPEPRLQGIDDFHESTPREDLLELERRHAAILESYSPAEEDGFYRIPIERAMEILVRRAEDAAGAGTAEPGNGKSRADSEDLEQGKEEP